MNEQKNEEISEDKNEEINGGNNVIGPGYMLAEARKALNISQREVAEKLNLTLTLVQKIERDEFDNKISSTYTRGYLKNFAKLVKVPKADIIYRYDSIVSSTVKSSGMQSFSKKTKKQAQHNQLMWFSYFVFALLIALTIIWWSQEHSQHQSPILPSVHKLMNKSITGIEKNNHTLIHNVITPQKRNVIDKTIPLLLKSVQTDLASTVTFTFKGDCWVNIYDATGKRIAWGIKKADYVMHLTGQAPFNITLGKPELVSILFKGKKVDMSGFNVGNIAKFTLPIKP